MVDKLRVPGKAHGVLLGMNDELYASMGNKKEVYIHSHLDDDVITNDKVLQADTTTYKEII